MSNGDRVEWHGMNCIGILRFLLVWSVNPRRRVYDLVTEYCGLVAESLNTGTEIERMAILVCLAS